MLLWWILPVCLRNVMYGGGVDGKIEEITDISVLDQRLFFRQTELDDLSAVVLNGQPAGFVRGEVRFFVCACDMRALLCCCVVYCALRVYICCVVWVHSSSSFCE